MSLAILCYLPTDMMILSFLNWHSAFGVAIALCVVLLRRFLRRKSNSNGVDNLPGPISPSWLTGKVDNAREIDFSNLIYQQATSYKYSIRMVGISTSPLPKYVRPHLSSRCLPDNTFFRWSCSAPSRPVRGKGIFCRPHRVKLTLS